MLHSATQLPLPPDSHRTCQLQSLQLRMPQIWLVSPFAHASYLAHWSHNLSRRLSCHLLCHLFRNLLHQLLLMRQDMQRSGRDTTRHARIHAV